MHNWLMGQLCIFLLKCNFFLQSLFICEEKPYICILKS